MKILFVSAVLPYPLYSGGQIRIYNLLKRLGQIHEITLCSFIRDSSELSFVNNLRFCRYVYMIYRGRAWQPRYFVNATLGRYPFLLATYDNGAMRQLLHGLLKQRQHDLIHLEPFYVWPSLPKTHLPVVVGEHNVEYEVYQQYVRRFPVVPLRPLLYLDTLKLRFWEEVIWKKAHAITAVSDHDERVIRRCNKKVYRVPNGVDLVEFPFREKKQSNGGPVFLFVGDFKWFPNQDAGRRLISDIWPLIHERFPEAQLRIVGRNIPSWLRRGLTTEVSIGENVEDIRSEYNKADMLLAPMTIEGGTKFKILEAMASGVPVISTPHGVSGIEIKDGAHYLKASHPNQFFDRIIDVWKDTRLRKKLIMSARKIIEEKYNWDSIAESLEHVWQVL